MEQEFLENAIGSYMPTGEGEGSICKIVFNYQKKERRGSEENVLSQYNTF